MSWGPLEDSEQSSDEVGHVSRVGEQSVGKGWKRGPVGRLSQEFGVTVRVAQTSSANSGYFGKGQLQPFPVAPKHVVKPY